MATEFIMPKLGLTMEEGTITEWFVEDGDTVTAGAAVMRIETDKTETDVEAAGTGRLHRLGQVGETFACGELIGWFLADGETAPASAAPAATAAPSAAPQAAPSPSAPGESGTSAANGTAGVAAGGRIIASPLAKRLAAERSLDLRAITGTGPGGRIVSEDLDGVAAGSAPATGSGTAAPVAAARAVSPIGSGAGAPATAAGRNLADLLGIDVAVVAPDPIEHRVTRESVALHVRQLLAAAAPAPPAATTTASQAPSVVALPAATQEPTSTVRLSGMRGTIARRMHDSLTQMAQLTLFMDADLDAVVADRERRKADGTPPSYTDYVIAAAARALGDHPLVNSQITADGVALLPTAHVGMAVALDNGLIVPVIHDTVGLDLDQLSAESTRLATAARAGSLDLADLEGGTFSVSTLGGFGVDGFTPVINPPNTAILGVGRLRDDLKLTAKGRAKATKRLTLSLTWDHRAFDGAPAAAFCRTIVELLDDPTALDTTTPTAKKDA